MLSQDNISKLKDEACTLISSCKQVKSLEEVRVSLLGKKGKFTLLMKELGKTPAESRKEFGAFLNSLKEELESKIISQKESLGLKELRKELESEKLDATLPVNAPLLSTDSGSLHPLTRVRRELEKIFRGLGFRVIDGPEVESEFYNFEVLNIPKTHPARDMQDTFWTRDGNLLRTHTSSMQVRELLKEEVVPPIRIVAPGRCFRYERLDNSHEHTFYQMEGMMIDKKVSVGHLIYFMKTLLREIFGEEQKIRLRPGYFPFVEPGFELDIFFQGKWLELLPCGLVHPKVLEQGKIDPKRWQGFAFGLGLSRLVMSRYQINDIRYLQGADLRFLKQFS